MKRRVLTIAAALAAFPVAPMTGIAAPTEVDQRAVGEPIKALGSVANPKVVYQSGDELLSLVVTQRADGVVVAQHGSHVSHASHSSHHSHYSSR